MWKFAFLIFTKLVEYSLEMYMQNIKGNSQNQMGREIGEDTGFKNGQQIFIIEAE